MKTKGNILIAFLLNLSFSIFELFGGIFTGSVAILSDAVHDLGDAASIGISYYLEQKSKKQADASYTYGYARFSVLGGLITTTILLAGSLMMIYNSVLRIITPVDIHYEGMILFAIVGVIVNFCAAFFTRGGGSLNQKAVNLHMLEDVFGWIVVLIGAVVMHFTDFSLIDPLMSMGVSLFILVHAIKNLKEIISIFLKKVPDSLNISELKAHIEAIDGVLDAHHIHIWSIDGIHHCATMHIVTDGDPHHMKDAVRGELLEHGIQHSTLELEAPGEHCHDPHCHIDVHTQSSCGHHHH